MSALEKLLPYDSVSPVQKRLPESEFSEEAYPKQGVVEPVLANELREGPVLELPVGVVPHDAVEAQGDVALLGARLGDLGWSAPPSR